MNGTYVVSVIVAMAIVTFALRALPFVAAQWLHSSARRRSAARLLSRPTAWVAFQASCSRSAALM